MARPPIALLVFAALSTSACYRSHTLGPPPPVLHVPFDVNGDGYADVVVGAPGNVGLPGHAFVYLGGPSGLVTDPATRLVSPDASDQAFGGSVAIVGDVNADGYADVVIGGEMKSYVYVGGPSGVAATPTTILSPPGDRASGTPVAGAGDVDGDGYDDVLVGNGRGFSSLGGCVHLFRGTAAGVVAAVPTRGLCSGDATMPFSSFGSALSSAGDIDADGFADVVVCDASTDITPESHPTCLVYRGAPSGLAAAPVASLHGSVDFDPRFGTSVASAGDVNGDGFADVIVGAPGPSGDVGHVYVFLGDGAGIASVPATTITDPGGFDGFGVSVAGAGDLDGDGYDDVLIGARDDFFSGAGRVYVYRGSASGLVTPAAVALIGPDGTMHGDFGECIAGAGDIDQDGQPDIIVGAKGGADAMPRATIYRGSSTDVLLTTPATLLTPPAAMLDGFGSAVASVWSRRPLGV